MGQSNDREERISLLEDEEDSINIIYAQKLNSSSKYFNSIPTELYDNIFQYLDLPSSINMMETCHAINSHLKTGTEPWDSIYNELRRRNPALNWKYRSLLTSTSSSYSKTRLLYSEQAKINKQDEHAQREREDEKIEKKMKLIANPFLELIVGLTILFFLILWPLQLDGWFHNTEVLLVLYYSPLFITFLVGLGGFLLSFRLTGPTEYKFQHIGVLTFLMYFIISCSDSYRSILTTIFILYLPTFSFLSFLPLGAINFMVWKIVFVPFWFCTIASLVMLYLNLRDKKLILGGITIFFVVPTIIFTIFVALKLDGDIDWSPEYVFIPLFVLNIIICISLPVASYLESLDDGWDFDEEDDLLLYFCFCCTPLLNLIGPVCLEVLLLVKFILGYGYYTTCMIPVYVVYLISMCVIWIPRCTF
eukprot:TRINITY_DN453_c0_g1_i1.p1 TRINITY_DN453_c0_g1~~TRINITY_DN453_c0_g1_i1.p1  ORF type:complete len:419 (+),score=24.98 TRINITY_DN453_c0_g1_i1:1067-2323(+)